MQNKYEDLNQQQLRNLYKVTGTLLLLDIPEGIEFGIDNILWKIGTKFRGIKFIPLGCHIVSYTLKDQNNMFKINKFLYFDHTRGLQNKILVYKWSNKYSMFLELKGSEAQGYRQGVNNYHFDSYLGPYPQENYEFWRQNTQFITHRVLQKLDPIQKIYKFQQQYNKLKDKQLAGRQLQIDVEQDEENDDNEQIEQLQSENEQDKHLQKQLGQLKDEMNNLKVEPQNRFQNIQLEENQNGNQRQNSKSRKGAGRRQKGKGRNEQKNMNNKFQPLSDTIYYSQIPRILINDPSHINKINIDKTQILIEVISKEYITQNKLNKNGQANQGFNQILGILGQLQYSFIYFLIGEDQQSFKQWKKLINLLSFSEDIYASKEIIKMRQSEIHNDHTNKKKIIQNFQILALQFVFVLYNQIKQFPQDFFIDELSKDNFVDNCLKRLKQYQNQAEGFINKKIKKRLQKLFKLLSTKFDYQNKAQTQLFLDQDAPIVVQNNQTYF